MNRTVALGILALAIFGASADGADYYDAGHNGLVGRYKAENASNDWHEVVISWGVEKEGGPYYWNNKAQRRWLCSAGFISPGGGKERISTLVFPEGAPYAGHVFHIVRDSQGKITHLLEFKPGAKESHQKWLRQ
ncbi:MAG: hypothetical protein KDA88_20085 [Planctomycetaceae bacterium]|nr:hypothetical protein [Planctomycetaceae bacterium]MCB9953978.1 hypothetical protein [Planctomycetaceae bacterium]